MDSSRSAKLRAIVTTAAKPGNFWVMVKKVLSRITDSSGSLTHEENLQWIKKHQSDFSLMAKATNADLWDEAIQYAKQLRERERAVQVPEDLAGSGFYPMLYFITRLRKPAVVVETGVCAGYTAHAFLTALTRNGSGHLYSSDFPLFRLENPERFIGMLVEPSLKSRWTLSIEGDEKALPQFARTVSKVDLFHYDSDKSYAGRKRALKTIGPLLANDALVVFDDIQDNAFFYELVQHRNDWSIFEWGRKYVGLLGSI